VLPTHASSALSSTQTFIAAFDQYEKQSPFTTTAHRSNKCIHYYEGHPKSFRPWHIRQQYFPQSIHQWNVYPLRTL